MKVFLAMLAAALLLPGCGNNTSGPSGNEGWKTYTTDNVTMQWMVEEDQTVLRVRLSAPTTGWVGVGFDPEVMMQGANFIIGYVSDGNGQIRDDFGTGVIAHQADTVLGGTSDVTLIAASEAGGVTELEFTIPMASGDIYDTVLQEGATHTILLAYGPNGADDFTTPHQYAKAVSLEL